MRAALEALDPDVPMFHPSTMAHLADEAVSQSRFVMLLLEIFATVAITMAMVGLYGVIAYSVTQRTREIGVRMALGAQRSSVYQLILREAGWLVVSGIGAGLICSVAAATLIRGLLFGVRSWDAATLAAVSAVLAVSAMLASYIPARRAARVDPMVALRYE
jgi:ABC-type antimicrobial peptide transport system permease subunit